MPLARDRAARSGKKVDYICCSCRHEVGRIAQQDDDADAVRVGKMRSYRAAEARIIAILCIGRSDMPRRFAIELIFIFLALGKGTIIGHYRGDVCVKLLCRESLFIKFSELSSHVRHADEDGL